MAPHSPFLSTCVVSIFVAPPGCLSTCAVATKWLVVGACKVQSRRFPGFGFILEGVLGLVVLEKLTESFCSGWFGILRGFQRWNWHFGVFCFEELRLSDYEQATPVEKCKHSIPKFPDNGKTQLNLILRLGLLFCLG